MIEELLGKGISVILDATNLYERQRRSLFGIARRTGAKFIIVRIKASADIVQQRLKDRARSSTGYSDADWKVYQSMKSSVENIRLKHYTVDTTKDYSRK